MAFISPRKFMWVVKASLAACLLLGLVFPDIPGVAGKGGLNEPSATPSPL